MVVCELVIVHYSWEDLRPMADDALELLPAPVPVAEDTIL